MAETMSKIKSANPLAGRDEALGMRQSQSPPRESGQRSRPQSKHVAIAPGAEEGRVKHLRIHASGLTLDPSGNTLHTPQDEPPVRLSASMDPLSRHIIHRTGSAAFSPPSTRRLSENTPLSTGAGDRNTLKPHVDSTKDQELDLASREKKKGVSFRSLRRLIVSKREEQQDEPRLDQGDRVDDRPEGADAQVFHHHADNIGYSPKHPQPPSYIRVRSFGKKDKDFNRLFLAQKLQDYSSKDLVRSGSGMSQNRLRRTKPQTGEATWAMDFSKDGQYLATAGQDKVVRIWKVISSAEERRHHEKDEEADENSTGENVRLSAPVFRKSAVQAYEGHTAPVLALSWSKNNFLLSSSMDKTVRLWHVSRPECLCAFKHHDYVTSIQFHPRDDRFFLAGSLDAKLRLWSIPDKSVAFWTQLPEMITSVAFTPDGKTAIAGCLSGLCLFYDTEGLRYQTQIHVRSTHGKNSKGSKITGIETINVPPSDLSGEVKILITSNDSRVRLYNLRDKSMEAKFKGNENSSSQIYARFNDDAKYIICGSEDARVFIWDVHCPDLDRRNKSRIEAFEAHTAATTVSLFAPARTRQLLSNSEDPLYDLCNPPPVTLLSRAERESLYSSRAASEKEIVQSPIGSLFKRFEDNPGYIARCNHPDGQIIVTGDAAGVVKVFRQDCAFEKRHAWDTLSTYSQKRFGGGGSNNVVGRSRQSSNATEPPGERILSWRQEVMRKGSITSSTSGNAVGGGMTGAGTAAKAGGGDSPPKSAARFPSTHSSTVDTGSSGHHTPPPLVVNRSTTSQQQRAKPDARPESSLSTLAEKAMSTPPPAIRVQTSNQQSQEIQKSSEHRVHQLRRNSNEYWERSAWRDEILQQLQQPPRKDGYEGSSHGSSVGNEADTPEYDDREPRRDTGITRDASDHGSGFGRESQIHGSGGQSRSPPGLLGLPPLQRGISNVSKLTDELTSAEPSEGDESSTENREGPSQRHVKR